MKRQIYLELLDKLHQATDFLQDVADVLNELVGDCDATEDIAAWRRSQFTVTTSREFWQNGGRTLPDGGELPAEKEEKEERKGVFKITDEEIKKMSKTIKGKFFTKGFAVCWRRRPSGKNGYTYQVRFQRGEYNIQFHEKRKDDLKPRFLQELRKQTENPPQKKQSNGVPTTFTKFAQYYFDNFRQERVAFKTFQADMGRFKLYIQPHFKDKRLQDILPADCKKLLKQITDSGKGKTADEVCSLLNVIFNCAVKHHILQYSPMDMVFHVQHERQHGTALTKEEEVYLLDSYRGSTYELPFAVALYTGMRPNEYDSARIDGDLIICINSKRKNRKVAYKRIAISPMLRPYLEGITELSFPRPETMREKIKDVLPNHKLYDLRTTFNTRCKECGVAEPARMEFMGHSLGELGNAYTDLSNAYLINEGAKLRY